MAKILLLYPHQRLRLPGRNQDGTLINPSLRDEVRLCYEVCDEHGTRITCQGGRYNVAGRYVASVEEAKLCNELQRLVGTTYEITTWAIDRRQVRFEAVRSFPCRVEIKA